MGYSMAFCSVMMSLLVGMCGCKPAASSEDTLELPGDLSDTNAASSESEAAPDLQHLEGSWVRPDGGYVIEIRQVDADGQLDAGYFNPKPIRVVSSTAMEEQGTIKVYLELNDEGYPGCKYNLTYIPRQDVLVGTYYQAALGQTFEVGFQRVK